MQVGEPFDVAVLVFLPHVVGFPEQVISAGSLSFSGHVGQRDIPAPGVDAGEFNTLIENPARGFGTHPGPTCEVLRRPTESIVAGVHQHDLTRCQRVLDFVQCAPDVSFRHRLEVLLMRDIEHHARPIAPLERDLVDGLGRLAFAQWPVMPRGVNVRGAVRREVDGIVGPTQPIPQVSRSEPEQEPDGHSARLVILSLDAIASPPGCPVPVVIKWDAKIHKLHLKTFACGLLHHSLAFGTTFELCRSPEPRV